MNIALPTTHSPAKSLTGSLIPASLKIILAFGGGCLALAFLASMIVTNIGWNPYGLSSMVMLRTGLLTAMGLYLLGLALPHIRSVRPTLVLMLPAMTQFYQLLWGWDCPAGAASLPRLIPLMVMALAMLISLLRRPLIPTRWEMITVLLVAGVAVCSWLTSCGVTPIGPTLVFLVAVLLPLCYFYVGQVMREKADGFTQITSALVGSMLLFLIGTLLVTQLGMKIGANAELDVQHLIYTRNVSDFNSIFPYLLLLWPFGIALAARKSTWVAVIITLLFVGNVAVGLSRTAFIVTAPLLVGSIIVLYAGYPVRFLKFIGAFAVMIALILLLLPNSTLLTDWSLRLNLNSGAQLLDTVAPGSTDFGIRDDLRGEGLRIWSQQPVIGMGWGAFNDNTLVGLSSAHNFFVDLLVETGIWGLGLFLALCWWSLAQIMRLWWWPHADRRMVILLLLSMVLWLVTMNTMGGNLYQGYRGGFTVNAINGVLFIFYLRTDFLRALVRRREQARP